MIIFQTEVCEQQHLGHAVVLLANKFRDCGIREMAISSHQALLQIPRVWPNAQHLEIVIGFENQNVRAPKPLRDKLRQISNVGELCDLDSAACDAECNRLRCVMWNPEWQHLNIPDRYCLARNDW